MLSYIYTGRVETSEVEVVKGIFLAANMLQMSDLEQLTVRVGLSGPCHICLYFACLVMTMWLQVNRLGKLCSLVNCLDLYFFVDTFCDIGEHASLHRKVGNLYPMLYRSFLKSQMIINLSYLHSASPLMETDNGSP